ncbi:MAG: hypothetical protein ABWZ25_15255 [Chitinophagaceae bacterium]
MVNYIYVVFIVLLMSCSRRPSVSLEEIATIPSDTLVSDFTESYYKFEPEIKIIEEKMGLPSLDKGFNGFQLRLTAALEEGGMGCVVLTSQNNSWTGKYWKVHYLLNWEQDSILSFEGVGKAIKPESGWPYLSRKLVEFDVLHLTDLNGGGETSRQLKVNIEIASKTQHRYYSMSEPDDHPDYPDAVKLTNIVQLFKREFNIEL